MAADEASWINDQDQARMTARPATFDTLLGEFMDWGCRFSPAKTHFGTGQ